MSAVGVGSLCLRVSAERESEGLRGDAERFVRAVLAAAGRRLDARRPGAVFRIRDLPVRWRLEERALAQADAGAVEACADDVIAALGDAAGRAAGALAIPPSDATAAAFAGEAARRAAFVVAAAEARGGLWFFNDLERLGGAAEVLTGAGAETCAEALRILADADRLTSLLAGWDEALVARIVAAVARTPVSVAPARGERRGAPDESPAGDAVAGPEPGGGAGAREALAALRVRFGGWDSLTPDARLVLAAAVAGTGVVPPLGSPAFADLARAIARPAAGGARPAAVPRASPRTPSAGDAGAGLVYCLGPLLELGAGETLWRACLSEASVLAPALSLLGGAAPFVAAFAGGPTGGPAPPVAPEQADEVVAALIESLRAALLRGSRSRPPALRLAVSTVGGARTLLAAADGLPFLAGAWRVADERDVETRVGELSRSWPLRADAALAAVVPHVAAAEPSPAPLVFDADAPAARIVSVVAGTAAALAAVRAGLDGPAFLVLLRTRGALSDDGETLTVSMPMDAIDLALRRAGLDRDPGWVPWLRRTVRIVFAEPAPREGSVA